jgi:hypothetical protein
MDDSINVSFSIPTDDDGFFRRECPRCEREFKQFNHSDDADETHADQYFCPLCGEPSNSDSWWTPAQLEYAYASASPAIDDFVNSALDDMLGGLKSNGFIKVERPGRYESETPAPEPLHEPNDMVIVEPPCHPEEPLKVPADATLLVHCRICGTAFAS